MQDLLPQEKTCFISIIWNILNSTQIQIPLLNSICGLVVKFQLCTVEVGSYIPCHGSFNPGKERSSL